MVIANLRYSLGPGLFFNLYVCFEEFFLLLQI